MKFTFLPCSACRRSFSSSSSSLVKRAQTPYDFPKLRHDITGRPIRDHSDKVDELAQDDPKWRKRVAASENRNDLAHQLAMMAEPPKKGFYEMYGAHDGYGLRNKPRYRLVDGKLEEWHGAGADWKRALGVHRAMFRPGQRVEVPGFQHRNSPRLGLPLGAPSAIRGPVPAQPVIGGMLRPLPPHLGGKRSYSTANGESHLNRPVTATSWTSKPAGGYHIS